MEFTVGQKLYDRKYNDVLKIERIKDNNIFVSYESPLRGITYYTKEELEDRIGKKEEGDIKLINASMIGKTFYKPIDTIEIVDESESNVYFTGEKKNLIQMNKKKFFEEYKEIPCKIEMKPIVVPPPIEKKEDKPIVVPPPIEKKEDKQNSHFTHYVEPTITLDVKHGRFTISKKFQLQYDIKKYKHVGIKTFMRNGDYHVRLFFTNNKVISGLRGVLHNLTVNEKHNICQITMKKEMIPSFSEVKNSKFTHFKETVVGNNKVITFKLGAK